MRNSRTSAWASLSTAFVLAGGTIFAASDKSAQIPSYYQDIRPLLKAKCYGCHHPGKRKGKYDMTSHGVLVKGGEEGAAIVPGKADKSRLLKLVVPEKPGADPEMPKKGAPLSAAQVERIRRWVAAGAPDDSPPVPEGPKAPAQPPVYERPPIVTAIAYAPDGKTIAVSGYHEVLLHKADGSAIVARLVGAAPRIEDIAFSPDGKRIAVCGGAPAEFGLVQVWDAAGHKLIKAFQYTEDCLFGVCFSPDGGRIGFGCVNNTARVIRADNGQEILRLKQHADWILGVVFTVKGERVVTGGRDKAIKLIDAANGQHIDDINNPLEPVLCMARHPTRDELIYGGGLGTPRIYRISDNQKRTSARKDTNLLRAFERQPGPVYAVAYSADGNRIAVGSSGPEARVYGAKDGKRVATMSGHGGAVFAVAFSPDGKTLATGGHDGTIRLFEVATGKLIRGFPAVPLTKTQADAK